MKEPQVRINDPQEDKALNGWIDKVQNLAEEKDNYANDLVNTSALGKFSSASWYSAKSFIQTYRTMCGHA